MKAYETAYPARDFPKRRREESRYVERSGPEGGMTGGISREGRREVLGR
jgi:hypothetical protein